MRNQAVKPDVPSILVIYGISLHLSNFSNSRSGGWGASNKHSLLSIPPLNRYTLDTHSLKCLNKDFSIINRQKQKLTSCSTNQAKTGDWSCLLQFS